MEEKVLHFSIRDVAPGEGFTRLNGKDGRDGLHTGGAFLSPDGKEVFKPLDGRPHPDADCHLPTQEDEILEELAGQPGFPRNWRIEERNGRRFLVRPRCYILGIDFKPSDLNLEQILEVEAAVRAANAHYWHIGDPVTVGLDRDYNIFLVDLSAARKEFYSPSPADNEYFILRWFEECGFTRLKALRERAREVCHPGRLLTRKALDDYDWPGKEWQHVYASRSRPISSIWASIPDAHYIPGDYNADGVWTWVVTPKPLDADTIYRYELTWGWSPVAYVRGWYARRNSPLSSWRVKGRLNIERDTEEGGLQAVSFEVDQIELAETAEAAVEQVTTAEAAKYTGVRSFSWLNSGVRVGLE